MKVRGFLMGVVCSFLSGESRAQGCSDAGFCTVGSFQNTASSTKDSSRQKLSVIMTNGIGDEAVYILSPAIQYDYRLSQKWAAQAKLTANYASGNLGNVLGLGDLFLSGSYTIKNKTKWNYILTAACKLPLNSGDLKSNNKSLPMIYQSSLGTVDFIGGLTLSNDKWLFSAAIQQPLSGENKNTFLPANWNTVEASKYLPANSFDRKGDALLKATYHFNTSRKWRIYAGLLGIYHLGTDTYKDPSQPQQTELVGSDGLTLNATGVFYYTIKPNLVLGITSGVPFVVRSIRPDGLTRAFVFSPELIYKF